MLAGKATGQTPRGEKVEKKTYKRRVKVMGLLNVRKKREEIIQQFRKVVFQDVRSDRFATDAKYKVKK